MDSSLSKVYVDEGDPFMNIVFQEQAQGLFQGSLQGSLQGILKKLARSISLLPNLHTVQIYFRPKGYYDSTTSSSNSYHSELCS